MMGYGWTGFFCGNGIFNIWFFAVIFLAVFFVMALLLGRIFTSGNKKYTKRERK